MIQTNDIRKKPMSNKLKLVYGIAGIWIVLGSVKNAAASNILTQGEYFVMLFIESIFAFVFLVIAYGIRKLYLNYKYKKSLKES